MVDCPDCERYKASASMWRNEAYRVAGHPLPWSPDVHLLKRALDVLEFVNKYSLSPHNICLPGEIDTVMDAIRARLEEK